MRTASKCKVASTYMPYCTPQWSLVVVPLLQSAMAPVPLWRHCRSVIPGQHCNSAILGRGSTATLQSWGSTATLQSWGGAALQVRHPGAALQLCHPGGSTAGLPSWGSTWRVRCHLPSLFH